MGTKIESLAKTKYSAKEWDHGLRCTAMNVAMATAKDGATTAEMLRAAAQVEDFLNGKGAPPLENVTQLKVQ